MSGEKLLLVGDFQKDRVGASCKRTSKVSGHENVASPYAHEHGAPELFLKLRELNQ